MDQSRSSSPGLGEKRAAEPARLGGRVSRTQGEIVPKSTEPPSPRTVSIGAAEALLDEGRVRRPGAPDALLRAQSLAVLRVLARERGRVVGKEALFEEVWAGTAVTEDSLVQCVCEIRRALGPAREMLRTLPGRGYMLAEIEEPVLTGADPIRFVRSADGVRIAWTASGRGVPLLKAPNWVSHLGHERRSRIYAPFYERLGRTARIVRFDQRGNGLSDWNVPPLTIDAMVADIEAVAEAAGLDTFFLCGLSQGAAYSVAFAARHPERVRGILILGGRGIGALAMGNEAGRRAYEAGLAVIRSGWDAEDPSYRRYFTSRIVPDATPELAAEHAELQRLSMPPANIEAYFEFIARIDVRAEAARLRVPVLLVHSSGDRMVPVEVGRELAAAIPGARFVEIEGDNHHPLPGTRGFAQALGAWEAFLVEPA
jgi:pimeloyl-ACP methyl ester carboxylesterase